MSKGFNVNINIELQWGRLLHRINKQYHSANEAERNNIAGQVSLQDIKDCREILDDMEIRNKCIS